MHVVGVDDGEGELRGGFFLFFRLLREFGLDGVHRLQLGSATHRFDDLGRECFAFRIGRSRSGGRFSGSLLFAGRCRNGDVNVLDGTERGKRLVEVFRIAYHQHGQLILMKVLCGDAVYVSNGRLLDARAILLEEIQRVAIELVGHTLAQNFVGRVEVEDERIEDGILGALDLVIGNRMGLEVVDILVEGLDGLDGSLALGAEHEAGDAGMVEGRADAAANGVSKPFRGADILHQA